MEAQQQQQLQKYAQLGHSPPCTPIYLSAVESFPRELLDGLVSHLLSLRLEVRLQVLLRCVRQTDGKQTQRPLLLLWVYFVYHYGTHTYSSIAFIILGKGTSDGSFEKLLQLQEIRSVAVVREASGHCASIHPRAAEAAH